MSVRDSVLAIAGAYASSGAITAEVKTNLGPAFTIYSGGSGGGLLDAFGIKAAVTVRRDGVAIASTGDPPETEPLVAAAVALVLAFAAGFVVALVRRL